MEASLSATDRAIGSILGGVPPPMPVVDGVGGSAPLNLGVPPASLPLDNTLLGAGIAPVTPAVPLPTTQSTVGSAPLPLMPAPAPLAPLLPPITQPPMPLVPPVLPPAGGVPPVPLPAVPPVQQTMPMVPLPAVPDLASAGAPGSAVKSEPMSVVAVVEPASRPERAKRKRDSVRKCGDEFDEMSLVDMQARKPSPPQITISRRAAATLIRVPPPNAGTRQAGRRALRRHALDSRRVAALARDGPEGAKEARRAPSGDGGRGGRGRDAGIRRGGARCGLAGERWPDEYLAARAAEGGG